MKRALFLLCLFVLCGSQLWAQRNCSAMDVLHQHIEQDPSIQQRMDQLERFTADFVRNPSRELNGTVVTIPTIVHVVYQNSTENISDAQINSQIQVLNDDFRRTNADAANTPADFQGVAADTEIEFCLTQIVRVPTSVSSFGTNNSVKSSSTGGSDVIDPAGSLNIWVCEIGGGILGYAQFPGGAAATDGIVVDYRYFGTNGTATAPFNLGRTTTHEVGHWLNLRHIWGDGGCNVDDFVGDTPAAGGPNYTGSPCTYPGPNSCRPRGRNGQDDGFDMFQNYMDYSDDGCMNLFTAGQKARMWAAINGSRPGLLTSACDGTPPPPPPAVEICDNGIDDDGDGNVDCADGDCANDPACVAPGTCDDPTGLTHTRRKGGREAGLSWNAVSGANSYDVEVYSGSTLFASGTITGTSATVGGLTKNAPYTWRVRANCTGATSGWSNGSFNARNNGALANLDEGAFAAYPNPTDQAQISLIWGIELPSEKGIFETANNATLNGQVRINMFDLSGKLVMSMNADAAEGQTAVDVSKLEAGMYLIQLSNESGYNESVKFVKQ